MAGLGFVVELTFLNGREKLEGLRRVFAAAVRQVMARVRRARVRALAKINLDLRVLGKRPDGYHELRTVFQTISLADGLELGFHAAALDRDHARGADVDIPDNLVAQGRPRSVSTRCASPAAWRFALESASRWARAWAADRRMRRRCCWRCRCSPAA